MKIRVPQKPEKDKWLPLWHGYLDFYESSSPDEVTNLTWGRFFDESEAIYILAAFDASDQMIGFTHYLFHRSTWSLNYYCYLEDLFVAPDYRGKIIGKLLITSVSQKAKERNCDRLYWSTKEDNKSARLLYNNIAKLSGFVQYRMPIS